MNMISIEKLDKRFGTKEVLCDMNLSLESGQIVGLVGPNGSGKTTLLKILAGLTSDYSGNIRIGGKPLGVETKAMVSYLPERTYLSEWMRCVDAIDYFNDFYSDFDRNKAMEMLEQLRLEPKQRIKTMSKGMQEKLQLTLVMGRDAKVYLLDEPIGGVDPATRSVILDAVLKQYSEDSLMVFATHLIADVERIFDRVIFLGFGEIMLHDEVDKIREKYGKSVDEVFREVFSCLVSL